jgi:hypothetical protein
MHRMQEEAVTPVATQVEVEMVEVMQEEAVTPVVIAAVAIVVIPSMYLRYAHFRLHSRQSQVANQRRFGGTPQTLYR